MVQKAVEMGAGRLRPVLTRHTQVHRVNLERMQANAIEAAEQCGILAIPEIEAPRKLGRRARRHGSRTRRLIFCDEAAEVANPAEALRELAARPGGAADRPGRRLLGEERADLLARPYVTALSLGPRILRADTAAVAALALVQAFIGDWR